MKKYYAPVAFIFVFCFLFFLPTKSIHAQCTNLDFSDGNFTNWNGTYSTGSCCALTLCISNPVPNPTQNAGLNQGPNNVGPGYRPKKDHFITTSGNDSLLQAIGYTVPMVWPGATNSARIGHTYGTGTGETLYSSFTVTPGSQMLTYHYAVVLTGVTDIDHTNAATQSYFDIAMTDGSGNAISCAAFHLDAVSVRTLPNFTHIANFQLGTESLDTLYFCTWNTVSVPLTAYMGQTVKITFSARGCNPNSCGGQHFCYAYLAAECNAIQVVSSSPAICGGNSITLTAPAGAASYQWSGPGVVPPTNMQTVTVNQAGAYSVSMTLYGNTPPCSYTIDTTVIANPGNPVANFSTDTVCAGSATAFTDKSTPAGSITKWYWDFNNDGIIDDSTQNPTHTFATAGSYPVKLTIVWPPCTADTTITVVVKALPTPTITATPAVCTGKNATITYMGNAPANATYAWNFDSGTPATGNTQGPYQVSWALGGSKNISFSVTENGCSADTTVPVTVNTAPIATFTAPDSVCAGQSTAITYTGGAPGNATYAWGFAGGNPSTGNTQGPYQVTWATANTENITLSVTQNGCTADTTMPVVISAIPSSAFTVNSSVCTNKSLSITYGGNAQANATYVWSFTGGTPATGNTQGPYQVSWANAGTPNITLSVTENGCSSDTSITITVNAGPTAAFSAAPLVCVNQAETITYTGNATGAATYAWSFTNGTPPTGNTQGPFQVSWATTGPENISLTVSENGCTADSTFPLVVTPVPTSAFTVDSPVCANQNTTVTYTGNALPAATYVWSFAGGTPATGNTQGPYQVSWANAGPENVTLSVTEAGCNSLLTTVAVTVNPTPVANAGPDVQFCSGSGNSIGSAAINGYSYLWTPVTGLSNAGIANPVVSLNNNTSSAVTTNYIVTTTANTCSSTDAVAVTVFPALVLNTPVVQGDSCFGDSNGCITAEVSGGTPSYSYVWTTGASGANAQLCGLPMGQYGFTVTDASGCTDSLSNIAVSQPTFLRINTAITNASCPGVNDGSIMADLTGGTPPYTYSWSNGGGNINPDVALAIGFYAVTVTDADLCSIVTTDTVESYPPLMPAYTIQNVACLPLTDGAISVAVSSSFLPISYAWSNGANTQSITGLAAGTYSVTVTDAHNCSADSTLNVITDAAYAITTLPRDTTINLGGQVYIAVSTNGVGGNVAGVNWQPSYGLSCVDCVNPVASPPQTTRYLVTITSDSGCVAVDTVNIEVIPVHQIYIPNVFSPGANANNLLQVYGNKDAWKFFTMSIFDRWGEKVFDTHDMDFSWDGTYKGKPLPMGVYVYEIRIVYADDYTDKSYNGSITLMR